MHAIPKIVELSIMLRVSDHLVCSRGSRGIVKLEIR
jgi:hypothetical protein